MVGNSYMSAIYRLRAWFWGYKDSNSMEHSSTNRKVKIEQLLKKFLIGENTWKFYLDLYPLPFEPLLLCEGAYLACLGYCSTDVGRVSKQWRTIKNSILSGSVEVEDELRHSYRHRPKYQHAFAYINYYAINHSDHAPNDEGSLEYIVPFPHVHSFHQEYMVFIVVY